MVWDIVIKWNYFKKVTIGKQIVTAADSISVNIAEGYRCYFTKKVSSFISIRMVLSRKQNSGKQLNN